MTGAFKRLQPRDYKKVTTWINAYAREKINIKEIFPQLFSKRMKLQTQCTNSDARKRISALINGTNGNYANNGR